MPGVLADGLALLFGRLFSPATTNMTAIAQSFYMEVDVHRTDIAFITGAGSPSYR